jgi:hypothetical protein
MAGKAENLVVRSVKQIQAAPAGQASFHDKRLLVRALSAMAKRVIDDASLLESLLCDPEHMETDIYYRVGQKQGREKGRTEGLHAGEEKALREAIADVLASRFGPVPEDLRARLEAVGAREELKRLVAAAARAADLDAFRSEAGAPPGAGG